MSVTENLLVLLFFVVRVVVSQRVDWFSFVPRFRKYRLNWI